MAHAILRGHSKLPAETHWRVATDLRRVAQWNVAVAEVRDVVGTPGEVGTTATFMIKGPDRIHEVPARVTDAQAPRLFRTEGHEAGGGMSYTSIVRYEPTPDGGTDWEWEQDVEPPKGLLGAFTDRLFVQRTIERQMQQSSDTLGDLPETEALQPA